MKARRPFNDLLGETRAPNPHRRTLLITAAILGVIVFFVMLNSVIGSFQQFQIPLLLTSGRWAGMLGGSGENFPPRAVHFYMLNVLIETFSFSRFGYANALIWLMFVVIVVLAAVLFWSQRYWVYTEAGGDRDGRKNLTETS